MTQRPIDAATGRRRTGRPATIDRAAIAAAALQEIDGIAIGRVAARLGVGPSTLYHHVSGRTELILLAAEAAVAEVRWPSPRSDWRGYLREAAESLLEVLLAHPGLPLALQALGVPPPGLRALMRGGVEHLTALGAAPEDAVTALSLVGNLAVDTALFSTAEPLPGDGWAGALGPLGDAPRQPLQNMLAKLDLILDGLGTRMAD